MTQPDLIFLKRFIFALLLPFCISSMVKAQTDFAPGEIMFTGYDSDAPDAFSFVLLKDVVSGTVIAITDRGWSNASGFRVDNNGEGTIELTFNNNYPCGTEIIFTDTEDVNDWDNPVNQSGTVVGTVAILAGGDGDGMELGTNGDQLFIYQNPIPTAGDQSNFITAINMDWVFSSGVWYPWNPNGTNSDDNSAKPNGLEENQVVVFANTNEYDNAKYDCDPKMGTGDFLRSAITNENSAGLIKPDNANNWNESDNYLSLATTCVFCCSTLDLTGPDIVSTNQIFTITIAGTLPPGESWQLYTTGCGVGSPNQTTMTNSFTVTAPATEGNVTYYVKASNGSDCPGQCAFISVCVKNTPLATCTSCSGNPETCGDCLMPDIDDNPDLDSGCYEIKLIFILDESGSIGGDAVNVKNGVLAFLNSLNGQDILFALIEFSDLARVVTDYTPINNALILNVQGYFNGTPFNGQTYVPNGGTNWHDAMIKADAMLPSDMVMFFTDGVPTAWTNNGVTDYCSSGSTTQPPEIINPVKIANKLKGEDTHMFMLGVGNGIDKYNLQLMSGPIEYDSTVNTIGSSDYSIGNFADLAQDLQNFVEELCASPLQLDKQLFGAVCNGVQQFRFIVHNPGTESAATYVVVEDEFPTGYTNPQYYGSPFDKVKTQSATLDFPELGYPELPNGFRWAINSVPPGGSDTIEISVNVLASGDYNNYATAQGNNTELAQDSVINPVFIVDDIPPVITCPNNVTIDCTESTLPANTGFATATDPDGSTPTVTYSDVIVPGSCPEDYIINRNWQAEDGCTNTIGCLQVIDVEDVAPQIATCAVTRNIEGCGTASITGPVYSTTTVASSVAVFENATNQGLITSFCGTNSITYIDVATGTCPTVVTRTWTVTDLCNNTATCVQIINVDDNGLPTLTACPVTRNIEGCTTSAITNPDYSTTVTASTEAVFENTTNQGSTSDGCGIATVTYQDVATNTCPTVVTRTWTISDACGNSTTCNQTINLDDTVLPTVTACAAARVIEGCGTGAITGPAYSTTTATSSEAVFENGTNQGNISDACGITSVTYIDVANGTCPTTVTRTWTISDACGNSSTCIQTITVDDTVLPTVTACAVARNVNGCNTSAITDPPFSATTATSSEAVFENVTNQGNISDACGITAVTYIDVASGTCPTVVTRTWTITDACANISTCNQTININDLAPSISACAVTRNIEGCSTAAITGPAYSTVTATSNEAEFENATNQGNATDACGITSVTYIDVSSGSCPTVVTRKWTVTDACGSTATCNQIINVDDNIAPSITACPVTRNIEGCTTAAITDPPYSATSATASEAQFENVTNQGNTSDACGITSVTYIDITAGTCPTVVTRKWTVTDACGNTTTCNQTINVDDNTSPTISSCPAPRVIEGCNTAAITGPAYSTTTATSSEAVFEDATNQGITSDVCGITAVTYIDVAAGTCPTVVTRKWTVTDACGNTTTCNQTITVDDTVAPEITTCAATRNIEGCSTAAITGPAYSTTIASSTEAVFENATNQGVASDACGVATVTYVDVAAGTCPIIVTRTWTITDACGNLTTCAQTINVDDTVAPSISNCAVTRNIEGCSTDDISGPAYSTTTATSSEFEFEDVTNQGSTSDACGITSATYIDVASGTCPIVVTRTWTMTDACGNATTCTQTINVDDTTPPSLTCPANITIECTESTETSNTGAHSVSDLCDPAPVVTFTDVTTASGTCPQEYTITRTWTATDVCGNTSACQQIITVDDSQAPVITYPADVTIECTENTLPASTGEGTASDNCDASPSISYSDVTMALPPSLSYQILRTWTATDTCGNSSTCLQTIRVDNPLDPEILGLPFDTICSGDVVEFESTPQIIDPLTYTWDFGSGSNPGAGAGPGPHEVVYTYNGTNGSTGAWVILTLGTPGCANVSDTVSNIHVNAIPNAAITASPGNPCIFGPKTFQPTAPSMAGFSYTWNFGAGAVPATANTYGPHTIEYSTAGSKTVQLIVFSNESGASCGDTSTVTFTVNTCPGTITGKVLKAADNSPIASVNLRLFADANQDGAQDNGSVIKNVFTTANGDYTMAAVTPGHYVIVETQPNNYVSDHDEDITPDQDSVSNTNMNDNIIPVTVEPSETDNGNYFYENPSPGTITGYVFEDFDNNAAPAPIEGLPDITIKLYTDNNTDGIADPGGLVTTTTTNGSGFYTIPNVALGNYVIIEVQPGNFVSIKDNDASADGDVVPNTNMLNDTIPCTITINKTDADNNFIENSVCSRIVTTTQDDVPGSLRYMIGCAGAEDTIRFHPLLAGQTLTINSGRIEFDKNLFIHSTLSPQINIESFVNGEFKILNGVNVEFKNVKITSGLSGYSGAAFENYGHLILWDVSVFRNSLLPGTEYLIFNGIPGILTVNGNTQIQTD